MLFRLKVERIHTLVIGAGQAGLSMGYFLKSRTDSFLLVDANERIGDSWRKRYDSLILFTPRAYSALPGLPFPGESDGYPTKDEVADYLELYANHFNLPVKLNTKVKTLTRDESHFIIETNHTVYHAQNVVIATGPFHKPFVPVLSRKLANDVFQFHSAEYRNPQQLREGSVLIVGAGNSGVQIATELAQNREVHMSVGKTIKMLPHRIFNKSLFWWFDTLRISNVTIDSKLGKYLSLNDPIIGEEAKPLINNGVIRIKPRTVGVNGKKIFFDDQSYCEVNNVIWATGFRPDYSWIKISGILDQNGRSMHTRGVTMVPGICFLGLSWQYTRGSALLLGVGKDAEYLLTRMSFDYC